MRFTRKMKWRGKWRGFGWDTDGRLTFGQGEIVPFDCFPDEYVVSCFLLMMVKLLPSLILLIMLASQWVRARWWYRSFSEPNLASNSKHLSVQSTKWLAFIWINSFSSLSNLMLQVRQLTLWLAITSAQKLKLQLGRDIIIVSPTTLYYHFL